MQFGQRASITGQFRARVEGFLITSGMAPSRLGREALADPNFVKDMRADRAFAGTTMDRVLAYIAAWEQRHRDLVA